MTPIFWISITWVLAATAVVRLPLHQRSLVGALLLLAALPILISIGMQVGWFMALLASVAVISAYPNIVELARALYRRERVKIDTNTLRFLVAPGAL
ncbi:DUF2484 family protein [Sulfitobacter aestuariivivens]|uniref:DUF2484 family protein n=1 Tax=Sulfitobacter aestuariivivens TaxID=2766981 RepID=A0A927D223_9RHOB|nr:DUF2484 family protein [Sulfitobacter aestuariivivens]MBD3663648.1 DUF2484 family protein [Sulfitobacter aestuariivivens]